MVGGISNTSGFSEANWYNPSDPPGTQAAKKALVDLSGTLTPPETVNHASAEGIKAALETLCPEGKPSLDTLASAWPPSGNLTPAQQADLVDAVKNLPLPASMTAADLKSRIANTLSAITPLDQSDPDLSTKQTAYLAQEQVVSHFVDAANTLHLGGSFLGGATLQEDVSGLFTLASTGQEVEKQKEALLSHLVAQLGTSETKGSSVFSLAASKSDAPGTQMAAQALNDLANQVSPPATISGGAAYGVLAGLCYFLPDSANTKLNALVGQLSETGNLTESEQKSLASAIEETAKSLPQMSAQQFSDGIKTLLQNCQWNTPGGSIQMNFASLGLNVSNINGGLRSVLDQLSEAASMQHSGGSFSGALATKNDIIPFFEQIKTQTDSMTTLLQPANKTTPAIWPSTYNSLVTVGKLFNQAPAFPASPLTSLPSGTTLSQAIQNQASQNATWQQSLTDWAQNPPTAWKTQPNQKSLDAMLSTLKLTDDIGKPPTEWSKATLTSIQGEFSQMAKNLNTETYLLSNLGGNKAGAQNFQTFATTPPSQWKTPPTTEWNTYLLSTLASSPPSGTQASDFKNADPAKPTSWPTPVLKAMQRAYGQEALKMRGLFTPMDQQLGAAQTTYLTKLNQQLGL